MRIAMLFLTLLLSGFSLNMALQGQVERWRCC
jgi:hypothetical protein